MKTLFFLPAFLLLHVSVHAQELTTTVDSYTGDTTYSTGFDTLNAAVPTNKKTIADRVVGVRNVHKGESRYWLFFYFSTSDITQKSVSISKKNFAYFVLDKNVYLRFPYSGRTGNYTAKDNAGFFIDVTSSIDRLQSAKTRIIRFETSALYHEIIVPDKKQSSIANIINKLIP
jgi:hypothetical protein